MNKEPNRLRGPREIAIGLPGEPCFPLPFLTERQHPDPLPCGVLSRFRGSRSLRDVYSACGAGKAETSPELPGTLLPFCPKGVPPPRSGRQPRRRSCSSFSLAALLLCAAAQAQTAPGLHHRSAENPDGNPAPTLATVHSTLPPEAEGEYPWGKPGQEIELYFDGGRLHGYMTEPSDPGNPSSVPVTFDFATSHVDGHAVAWTTRQVHGDWWSFAGHLERGLVASPTLPGYYLLTGTLTEHTTDAGDLPRTVSLKREPGSN